jgi:hypothetical protein
MLSDRNGPSGNSQAGAETAKERLIYIEKQLAYLGELAEKANSPMLVYLLSVAEEEARDLARRLAGQQPN